MIHTCQGTYLAYTSLRNTFCMQESTDVQVFLILNFRRVLNAVCFLLGNSPASEFYILTFRNTLLHLYRRIMYEDGTDRVFRNVGI